MVAKKTTRKITKINSQIQVLVSLKNSRRKRTKKNLFVVEGKLAVFEALNNGWEIVSIFLNSSSYFNKKEQMQLYEYADKTYKASPEIMKIASEKNDPISIVAICKIRNLYMSSFLPQNNENVVMLLDSTKSARNIGVLIRSAVVFGIKSIIISGHAADHYDPKCIRSSVGTFFSINIYKVRGSKEFFSTISMIQKKTGIKQSVFATKHNAAIDLNNIKVKNKNLLRYIIIGNESKGISKQYEKFSDYLIKIPTKNTFSSLNLAVAASIIMYKFLT